MNCFENSHCWYNSIVCLLKFITVASKFTTCYNFCTSYKHLEASLHPRLSSSWVGPRIFGDRTQASTFLFSFFLHPHTPSSERLSHSKLVWEKSSPYRFSMVLVLECLFLLIIIMLKWILKFECRQSQSGLTESESSFWIDSRWFTWTLRYRWK